MGKNGQFRYAQSRKISKKPVKATRLRNKNEVEKVEHKPILSDKIIGRLLYIVSFSILLVICHILGIWR